MLDIEFALDVNHQAYLLQVRSITTQPNWNRAISKKIVQELHCIEQFISERCQPKRNIFGETTVLGQMPDWNPAEMIGRAPRALAFSLYTELITKSSWRIAREKMNYAVPKGQWLMVSLAGQPYIDTRLSFHSFLPNSLDKRISNKLVSYWVHMLKEQPHLHDKVEFDIAITAFDFTCKEKINSIPSDILNSEEKDRFFESLVEHSIPLLKQEGKSSIKSALNKLDLLESETQLWDDYSLDSLLTLVSVCKKNGTIPFSILARHGFIAKSLLKSLEELEIMSATEVEEFTSNINTVASEFVDELAMVNTNKMDLDAFMIKYGHLRPGTYDILCNRYDQLDSSEFLSGLHTPTRKQSGNAEQPEFLSKIYPKITKLLGQNNIPDLTGKQVLDYCVMAIQGREYGKFIFTKTVSLILEIISSYGERNGLTREEMSHIPIGVLQSLASSSNSNFLTVEEHLRQISEKNKEQHQITSAIRLPQVISDSDSAFIVPFQVSVPNFITNKTTRAKIVLMDSHNLESNIDGKIVLIENADPGYDWIFSKRIKGLITKYGGANSHMAIRSAEFGIPAAIGCGEQMFDKLAKIKIVTLDCGSSKISWSH